VSKICKGIHKRLLSSKRILTRESLRATIKACSMSSGLRLDWAKNSLSIACVESGVATGGLDPDATVWLVVAGDVFRRNTGDASCSFRWGGSSLFDRSGFTRDLPVFGVKKFESMLLPLRLNLERALALSAAALVSNPAVTCGMRFNQTVLK
jgi:hypothetical protein